MAPALLLPAAAIRGQRALLWLLCLLWLAPLQAADQREVYTAASPAWLAAVGKLQVPGSRWENGSRRHHREDCSATLVSAGPGQRADTVVTAWHCLEFYTDLSQPLLFTLLPGSSSTLTREVYRVADGGGMHADWAILKMHQPIRREQVAAIIPHPQRADASLPVTMAGYSRDGGLGADGEHLTYDDACTILRQSAASSDTDCRAHKGASGGAVVQLSESGEARLSGVISRGDSRQLSIYVPVLHFRSELRRHLN